MEGLQRRGCLLWFDIMYTNVYNKLQAAHAAIWSHVLAAVLDAGPPASLRGRAPSGGRCGFRMDDGFGERNLHGQVDRQPKTKCPPQGVLRLLFETRPEKFLTSREGTSWGRSPGSAVARGTFSPRKIFGNLVEIFAQSASLVAAGIGAVSARCPRALAAECGPI